MATTYMRSGLYAWTVELENGQTRQLLSSYLPTHFASPVVNATRGAAFDPTAPSAVVTALVPTNAQIGGANFTLHVNGTGFRVGDVILWNGTPEPTTMVSATELTTGVDMATATTPGQIPVAVRSLNGAESNVLNFTLLPAP